MITIGVALTGWLLGAASTRRKNTREDRAQVLAAIRAARRFQAPRAYYDLDADLYLLRDALVPFPALRGHGLLVDKLTRALWRDSHQNWEENEGEPGAGSYSADLADALDEALAALSGRVRAPRWRQRWGTKAQLAHLKEKAQLAERLALTQNVENSNRVIDPSGFINEIAGLKRYLRKLRS